jgi:hypothetical protein
VQYDVIYDRRQVWLSSEQLLVVVKSAVKVLQQRKRAQCVSYTSSAVRGRVNSNDECSAKHKAMKRGRSNASVLGLAVWYTCKCEVGSAKALVHVPPQ